MKYKNETIKCNSHSSRRTSANFADPKTQLDTIQKRAIRLIDDSSLTDSLAHRRNWWVKVSNSPPKACFARSTCFADSQHSFAVKLEKCRTPSFANTFVPMTSRNWNSLPASIFPRTYNLQTFKTRVHKHLRLTLSLDQLSLLFGNARIVRDT